MMMLQFNRPILLKKIISVYKHPIEIRKHRHFGFIKQVLLNASK